MMNLADSIAAAKGYQHLAGVLQKHFALEGAAVRDALGLWHFTPSGQVHTGTQGFKKPTHSARVAFAGAVKLPRGDYHTHAPLISLKLETIDLAERVKRLKLVAASEGRLAQTELKKARTRARRQFEQKLELFGRYSHDLKTPFSMLVSNLENMILEEDELPVKLRLRLEAVRSALYGVLRTAGHSLDAARLLTRKKGSTLIPFNFSTFVREIVEVYAIVFESYSIRLDTNIDPDIAAEIDPIQMEKVINNLLNNAIKHNIPGGLAHISLREAGGRTVLTIADTGLGFTGSQTVKEANPWRFASHGYGLGIVRELVRLNRGKMDFRSEGGVGTTVAITLPAQEELKPVVHLLRRHNFQTTLQEVEFLASERSQLSRRKKNS